MRVLETHNNRPYPTLQKKKKPTAFSLCAAFKPRVCLHADITAQHCLKASSLRISALRLAAVRLRHPGVKALLSTSLLNFVTLRDLQHACSPQRALVCEDLEPALHGSCTGPREAMTDHILGIDSKISSLFSFHKLPEESVAGEGLCIFELAIIY